MKAWRKKMKVRRKKTTNVVVIWAVFGVMMAGMAMLATELWHLQLQGKSGFDEIFLSQSVRRVRLPAVRGRIYDTQGKCIADSVPNYCIAIYTAELRAPRSPVANTLVLIHEIWEAIGREPDLSYAEIYKYFEQDPPYVPLCAWKNVTAEEAVKMRKFVAEKTAPAEGSLLRRALPGIDVEHPVDGRSIFLLTHELAKTKTTTAANALELVYKISERIGIPREITLQDIKNHIFEQRLLPLMAWENIDEETLARWADTCSDLIGTDIIYESARTYPEGETLAHLLGFTLQADPVLEQEGELFHFDLRGIEGRKGVEQTYNDLLKGTPGQKLVQIDVSGYLHRELQLEEPQPGGDLELAIDSNIQRFAAEVLAMKQNGESPEGSVRGACVVLDPRNGDVLASVSSPSFDPNQYMNSASYRQSLMTDPEHRAINRAVYGQYPPGSTFKPIATLGVLSEYSDYTNITYRCVNPWYVDKEHHKYRKKCWIHSQWGAHGEISLRQALMYSCNVYMWEMALDVGFEPIHSMAQQMGLGQYAGLFPELGKEPVQLDVTYGSLPDHANNDIDLCNMAIGQGGITASPLQMAMVAATLANGGTLYRPRLIKRWRTTPDAEYRTNPVRIIRKIDLPDYALETVRGGMFDVVQHAKGTAKKARVNGVNIAGKTGSAQYKKKVNDQVVNSVHAWMISFAPFENPRYAVAMMVEDGVSGGTTIAPRLSALYTKIFEYEKTLDAEVRP